MTDSNLSCTEAHVRKLALILERGMLADQLIRSSLLAAAAEQAVADFDVAHPEVVAHLETESAREAAAFAQSN